MLQPHHHAHVGRDYLNSVAQLREVQVPAEAEVPVAILAIKCVLLPSLQRTHLQLLPVQKYCIKHNVGRESPTFVIILHLQFRLFRLCCCLIFSCCPSGNSALSVICIWDKGMWFIFLVACKHRLTLLCMQNPEL